MEETGGKIGPKGEKDPISLGLEGEILQFVPETLEHPYYTFLMTNLFLLSQKMATKLKKTVFLDQFHTVPSIFSLSLPKIMGQVCYFIRPPLLVLVLTWISQSFHSLCQSKIMEGNFWGVEPSPPPPRNPRVNRFQCTFPLVLLK